MRASLLAPLLVLVLASPAAAQDPPPLAATLAGCNAGPTAEERFAVFTGSMPALAGTERMAMRFDLRERRASSRRWKVLPAPRFGSWQRSKPGRSGFVYTKRVEGLRQGAVYEAVVRFRWYDANGVIQRETRRRTKACVQPDQRPDLLVEAFDVRREADGTTTYVVTVANEGLTAAGPFALGLVTPDGEAVRRIAGLAALERTTLEIRGPACAPRDRIELRVDPAGQVSEADERDNGSVRLCPDASDRAPTRR